MTDYLKRKWRMLTPLTRTLTMLLLTAGLLYTLIAIADDPDTDGDGMSDTYETFFGLNPNDASDATNNLDSDALLNIQEYTNWNGTYRSDPFAADTDEDGWNDDADANPVSRAYLNWGDAQFTSNNILTYTYPAWMYGASKAGGTWDTNAQTWVVSISDTNAASLNMEIYPSSISNDLAIQISYLDQTNAVLYLDLLDTNETALVTNLYGNLLTGTQATNLFSTNLPLATYTNAAIVRLRRSSGEITIYDSQLYIDLDFDGLDDHQELQLGTSDTSLDSDSDDLNDTTELTHGTDPADPDTDNDGINDGNELYHGQNPTNADSYSSMPFTETFETLTLGELNSQNRWTATPLGTATVQSNNTYQGAQALHIQAGAPTNPIVENLIAAEGADPIWIDMQLIAKATTQPTNPITHCAALYINSDGQLVAYSGDQWQTLTNHPTITMGQWTRLTLKLNYTQQKWLLCLNSLLAASDLDFGATVSEFSALQLQGRIAYADNILISTNIPDGISADGDNLPDNWELQHFGNLDQTDTDDPDSDSLNNLGEYQASTDPTDPDTDADNLTDNQEISTYNTDPNLLDTDNDGYIDSTEITKSTDPLDPASYPYDQWTHSLKISIQSTTNTFTNMPVLVVLDSTRLNYADLQPDGADLRLDDPYGTQLDYQITQWDTNGTSHIWVRIPTLSDNHFQNHFWLHWGNATAPVGENASGVWTADYAGIWHMTETSGQILDSTPGAYHGLNQGSTSVSGQLGPARDLDTGTITLPPQSLADIDDQITISFWQYMPEERTIAYDILLEGINDGGRELLIACPYGNSAIYWLAFGNYDAAAKTASESQYKGAWHHWAFTKNAATGIMDIYHDGQLWKHDTGNTRPYTAITSLRIGSYAQDYGYAAQRNSGIIDELFISKTERNAAWIQAQYNIMNDNYLIYGSDTLSIAATQNGSENGTNALITISRTGAISNLALTVNYTLSGTATAGEDYTNNLTGTLTLSAGQTEQVITIGIIDDTLLETNETVTLTLTTGNYLIDPTAADATITILDNDLDSDTDGLADAWETAYFGDLSHDGTADGDTDGLTDLEEYQNRADPTDDDTDDDGLTDGHEVDTHGTDPNLSDTDADGMPDNWELDNSLSPTNAADAVTDADSDGVLNLEEYTYDLDPQVAVIDTDSDTLSDAEEIYTFGTHPKTADSDTNGLNDAVTILTWDGTNTSHRYGNWAEEGTMLRAASNKLIRCEYEGTVTNAHMYRIGLQITNCSASATSSKTFKLQLLIDQQPFDWLSIPVNTGETAWAYAVTPWMLPTNHTLRIAWLDNYAANKQLGIVSVILQELDAPDADTNNRQDWAETILAQELDTDRDRLSDLYEIDTSGTDPLNWDTDGDTLSDGEETDTFGSNPLLLDSDANGTNDAYIVIDTDGIDTASREVWHSRNAFRESGTSLYYDGIYTANRAHYDITVSNAGLYRVVLQMKNYEHDIPDNFRYAINLTLDDMRVGAYDILADVDRSGYDAITLPYLEAGTYRLTIRKINNGYFYAGRALYPMYDKIQVYAIDNTTDANTNGVIDVAEDLAAEAPDTDKDGISDYDELLIYGSNPILVDSDQDGVRDGDEVEACTDPSDNDTDNDGMGDGWEQRVGSDPFAQDYTNVSSPIATITINPSATNATEGAWAVTNSTQIQAQCRRGSVSYTFTATNPTIYSLQIAGTQGNDYSGIRTFKLLAYIDGEYLGYDNIDMDLNNKAYYVTPWLTNGAHTLKLFWDGAYDNSALRITEIKLIGYDGPDVDSNGVIDWIDNRIETFYSIDAAAATNISPLCLEGKARFISGVTATVDGSPVTVNDGVAHRWYADVTLNPTSSVEFVLSVEHGTRAFTNTLSWQEVNVLYAQDMAIRKDDTLLLTVVPTGATNGTVEIDIVGVTNYTTDVDTPVEHSFTSNDTFTVIGTHDNGTETTNSIAVDVILAQFPTNAPAVWWGKSRKYENPDIPEEGVELEFDDQTFITRLEELAGGGISYYVGVNDADDKHYLAARLENGGPICDTVKIDACWLIGNPGFHYHIIEYLEDGTMVTETRVTVGYLPDDCTIKLGLLTGGSTFEDGATVIYVTAADLNEVGEYVYRMYTPPGEIYMCHYVQIWEGDTLVGRASTEE